MIKLFLKDWTFFRMLRLAMGVIIIVQSFLIKDVLFGIAGFLFTLMALLNQGCCNTQTYCTTKPSNQKPTKEIDYEEVV
jgi:hypothetical protein